MTRCDKAGKNLHKQGRQRLRQILLAYGELVKIPIVGMILVACSLGLLLAGGGQVALVRFGWTLFGTAVFAAGACALNQYQDREADGRMERTRHRPLPSGRILPTHALVFGLMLVFAGYAILAARINLLTAGLGLLTTFL
ncbi:MAG: UbiA family prenyltransferase, partial [Kiritimatiellaeota bacterium]|nr:UbiA family prenyltransferase [Kiritimatiellota bacterium]